MEGEPPDQLTGGELCLGQAAQSVVVDAVAVTADLEPEGGQARVEGEADRPVDLKTASETHRVGRHVGVDDRPLA